MMKTAEFPTFYFFGSINSCTTEGGFAPWISSPYSQEEIMDEHLAAWQIAEFTLGCLDEDELE